MATTLNGRTVLHRAPSTFFRAPNGVNDNVSACNGDAADLAAHFVQWWNDNLETVKTCYGWRASNAVNPKGPTNSNHLSASAWDVNGAWHHYELYDPWTEMYRDRVEVYQAMGFNQSQLDKMRRFSNSIKGRDGRPIFRLGIDFARPYRDPMHFEVAPWTSDADLVFAVAALGSKAGSSAASGVLKRGSRGAAVGSLQKFLNSRSGVKPKVKVDDAFGPATEKALKTWQGNNGLKVDGVYGAKSKAKRHAQEKAAAARKAKAHTLRKGDRGAKVGELQSTLNRGYPAYSHLKVDKVFGPATDKVVREFQKRAGLKVDGIVGPATAKRLGIKL